MSGMQSSFSQCCSQESIDLALGGWHHILNPAAIKVAYESNPDTNAFTDSYKQKLDNLEAGTIGNSFVQEETPDVLTIVSNVADAQGAEWYKPSECTTYIFYVDANGNGQWVEEDSVGDDSGSSYNFIQEELPTDNLFIGARWFVPSTNREYVYYKGPNEESVWTETSDLGIEVGASVLNENVPTSSVSPGILGQIEVDENYVYFYIGDGTTHSWGRVVLEKNW